MAMKMRAFRYATLKNLSRTYGTHPLTNTLPAIKMAGYPYQMPMASLPKLELIAFREKSYFFMHFCTLPP